MRYKLSPVIGVILMVALTVIFAAVITAFVFGMSGNIQKIDETYNQNITVKTVHYLSGPLRVPCVVLTTEGQTFGVDELTDCIKLENSTAQVYATDSGHIIRVKVIP